MQGTQHYRAWGIRQVTLSMQAALMQAAASVQLANAAEKQPHSMTAACQQLLSLCEQVEVLAKDVPAIMRSVNDAREAVAAFGS